MIDSGAGSTVKVGGIKNCNRDVSDVSDENELSLAANSGEIAGRS